jgi:putative transposase
MISFLIGFLAFLNAFFRSRYSLGLEILALRQQLRVLKRKHPRPRLRVEDRIFWILLRRLWPTSSNVLVIVKPEPVAAWHRTGFRLFWRIRSRPKSAGRPIINAEVRDFIRRMAEENPGWGAPRIREIIAAMDFFTVPTLTFRVLYCFFVIEHGRRRILYFNVTEHPTGPWIVQQLRETLRESCQYRYVILDRDGKFGEEVAELLTSSGMKPTRTSAASPWQNGIAERWIGSCRRELLDHVIVLNDAHLRRLIRDYISYYHADRIHDSLKKDTPAMRPVSSKPGQSARLVSLPRIGGLHHRYDWQQAA